MGVSYCPLFRQLRERNIRHTELAEKCSLSTATIEMMRRGEYVSLAVIDRICDYLECPMADVVELTKKDAKDSQARDLFNGSHNIMPIVRDALDDYMINNDYSPLEMSELTGLSQNTIRGLLGGNNITSMTFQKLATRLGSDFVKLLQKKMQINDSQDNPTINNKNVYIKTITKQCDSPKTRVALMKMILSYIQKDGMTKKAFAESAGVSINTLSRILDCETVNRGSIERVLIMFDEKELKEMIDHNDYSSVDAIQRRSIRRKNCNKCKAFFGRENRCLLNYTPKEDRDGSYYSDFDCPHPNSYAKAHDEMAIRGAEYPQLPNVTFYPAKPVFRVSEDEYIALINRIPRGKLVREKDITAYFERKYHSENIQIEWASLDVLGEKAPYHRIVSNVGNIFAERMIPIAVKEKRLADEGFEIVSAGPGKSLRKVSNYKDFLFDLLKLL